jgi:uncharacterized protein HemX
VPIAAAPESPPAPPASAQPSPSPGTKQAKQQGITPASNSAWNIISLLGFLLASGSGAGAMADVQGRIIELVKTIEALDQRLKKLRTSDRKLQSEQNNRINQSSGLFSQNSQRLAEGSPDPSESCQPG